MVKEGLPFVLVPAVAALFCGYFQLWLPVAVFVLIAAFMAIFFRDPYRQPPEGDDLILSAADGKVTRIQETDQSKLVSIFLSPFNVHINRSPIAGKITKIEYIHGKRSSATDNRSSVINERNALTIENEKISVVCTQIAGLLARRIVCWNKEGDELESGQKFGMIKFGSRTDVLMPPGVDILVSVGDRVKAGETVIARMN